MTKDTGESKGGKGTTPTGKTAVESDDPEDTKSD